MNLSLVTYTHSSCRDIWKIHFGQLDKFLPNIDSYVISDVVFNDFPKHKVSLYDDSKPYWTHWVNFLEKQNFKYFIYLQEDFFLINYPNIDKLNYYINFLENSKYSFVRLIANDLLPFINIENDLFLVKPGHDLVMQPTIWKREDFIKLYSTAKVLDFVERPQYNIASKNLNLFGTFAYHGQPKHNSICHHYDSLVYPYIATGIVRRKWNTYEYNKELIQLTTDYNIDMKHRGFYNPNETQPW